MLFPLHCCSIWNSLDCRIIPRDTTENRFFSFSKNTQTTCAKHLHIPESSHSEAASTPQETHRHMIIYMVPHTHTLPHTGKRQSHGRCRSQNVDFLSLADIVGLLFAIGNRLAWTCFPNFLHLCRLWEDMLFSVDPQNKMFHNWFCWELMQLHAV